MTSWVRKPTVPVLVGDVTVGGSAPVAVQSMTNTDTADAAATADQAAELAAALEEALAADGPALLEIMTDAELV